MAPVLREGERVQITLEQLIDYKTLLREKNELEFNRDFLMRHGAKEADPHVQALAKRLGDVNASLGKIGKLLEAVGYAPVRPQWARIMELTEKINTYSEADRDRAMKEKKGELYELMRERGSLSRNNYINREVIAGLELIMTGMPAAEAASVRAMVEAGELGEVDVSSLGKESDRQNLVNYLNKLGAKASIVGEKLVPRQLTAEEISRSGVKSFSYIDLVQLPISEGGKRWVPAENAEKFMKSEELIRKNRGYTLLSPEERKRAGVPEGRQELDAEYAGLKAEREGLAWKGGAREHAEVPLVSSITVNLVSPESAGRGAARFRDERGREYAVEIVGEGAREAAKPGAPGAAPKVSERPGAQGAPAKVFEKAGAAITTAAAQAERVAEKPKEPAEPYEEARRRDEARIAREAAVTKGMPVVDTLRRAREGLGKDWTIHTYTDTGTGYTRTVAVKQVKRKEEQDAEDVFWGAIDIAAKQWAQGHDPPYQNAQVVREGREQMDELVNSIANGKPGDRVKVPAHAITDSAGNFLDVKRAPPIEITLDEPLINNARQYRRLCREYWANERYELAIAGRGTQSIYLSYQKERGMPGQFYREWWGVDVGDNKFIERGVIKREAYKYYEKRERVGEREARIYEKKTERVDIERREILPKPEELLALETPADREIALQLTSRLLQNVVPAGTNATVDIPPYAAFKAAAQSGSRLLKYTVHVEGKEKPVEWSIEVDDSLLALASQYKPILGEQGAAASLTVYQWQDRVIADEDNVRRLLQADVNRENAEKGLLPVSITKANLPVTEATFFDNVGMWSLANRLAKEAGVLGEPDATVVVPPLSNFEMAYQSPDKRLKFTVKTSKGAEEKFVVVDDRLLALARASEGIAGAQSEVKVGGIDSLLIPMQAIDLNPFGLNAVVDKPSPALAQAVQKLIEDKRQLALANEGKYEAERQVVSYWYGKEYDLVGNYDDNWQIFRGEVTTYGKEKGVVYSYLYINTKDKHYTLSVQDKLNDAWVVTVFGDDTVTLRRVAVGMSNEEIRKSRKTGISPYAFRIYETKEKERAMRKYDELLVTSLVNLPGTPKVFGSHVFSRGDLNVGIGAGESRWSGGKQRGYNISLRSQRPRDVIQLLYDIKKVDEHEKGYELVFYPGNVEVRNQTMYKKEILRDSGALYKLEKVRMSVRFDRVSAYRSTVGEEWTEQTGEERAREEVVTGARYDFGGVKSWERKALNMYGGYERREVTETKAGGERETKDRYAFIGGALYKLDEQGNPIFTVASFDIRADRKGISRTEITAQSAGQRRVVVSYLDQRGQAPLLGVGYREGMSRDMNFALDTRWRGGKFEEVMAQGTYRNLSAKIGFNRPRQSLSFGLEYSF